MHYYQAISTILATAAVSYFLTRASILEKARDWVQLRSNFLGELVTCHYCMAHWVAAGLVVPYGQRFTEFWWPLDYALAVAGTAFLATMVIAVLDRLMGVE